MILSNENRAVALDRYAPADLHYTVLDYSDGVDFYCHPVLFTEHCRKRKVKVSIGGQSIVLGADWGILVGDRWHDYAELVTVREAVERDFNIVIVNPLGRSLPVYHPIKLEQYGGRVCTPRYGKRQLLAMPLTSGANPPCIFVGHSTQSFLHAIDTADLTS